MEDKKLARDLRKNKPTSYRKRSDLYRYIRANIRLLTEAGYGTPDGPNWQELTDRLNRAGQVNKHNQPLRLRGVVSIFNRVTRDLLAEERAQRTGTPTKMQPARAPRGWTPPLVGKPNTAAAKPAPFAPTGITQEKASPASTTPDDMLADLWSQFDKRSGR
jgi:hypothetical protein